MLEVRRWVRHSSARRLIVEDAVIESSRLRASNHCDACGTCHARGGSRLEPVTFEFTPGLEFVEGPSPTRRDVAGHSAAIVRALVIIGFAARVR